ncbi:HMG box domain-containing protein [Caerostris darwini]|uniref:HMG box domain-containing protein n=1 Tax=Caerostris darwini TaxID=1538125 RepID=A0AAV4U342_9ARAC|nr:HMG box domain-containing protein [Caerostris darwini]
MLYAREHRKSLASEYPTHNNKNISSLLGERWRTVDEETKQQYYRKAKMLEELHKQKYPGYIYSPRIARIQKMARKKKNIEKCNVNSLPIDNEMQLELPTSILEQSSRGTSTSFFPGRHSEECEMQPGMYVDNYYPRNVSSNAYDCNTWERYHDSVYEPSMTHSWNACSGSCSLGCRRECSAIQPNVEQEHFAHLPPSAPYPEYQSTYYNCNSTTACCNPHSLPYTYEPCRDNKMMVCNGWSRTCAHWKTPSNAPPPYCYQNMDYYCNQSPDYFRGYYAKCPAEYDYSSEVCDNRQAKRKETGEPVTVVQAGESPSQYVEQENVESNADEIVNVVDEDNVEPKVLPFLPQDDNGAITSSVQLQIGAAQNVV